MYPDTRTLGSNAAARSRTGRLDTIQDYGYQAAYKVATDDTRERFLAEAALSRLLSSSGLPSGRRPILGAVRQRLGGALIGVGARLQGADHPWTGTAVPASVDVLAAR